jgi:hypothetical protein
MLCDYGCGQEAKYQFKNRKNCCSESYKSCSEVRKKIREKRALQVMSKETKEKIRRSKKGRKRKPLSEETKRKIGDSVRGDKNGKRKKSKTEFSER